MEEPLDEAVLNLQQRVKRAQILRAHEKKVERARELAKKRHAPEKNLKKRAYAHARQLVRRRVAGQRGAEYEKLSPSEKMVIDRQLEKKQKAIQKLASRLLPRVRSAEQKRLSSFMKGQALQNKGAPEGNHKAAPSAAVNEKFAGTFKKTTAGTDDPVNDTPARVVPGNKNILAYNDFDKEANTLDPAVAKALKKKSVKSGVDDKVVKEVYLRGLVAWKEEYAVSREQYAFARVNSFINKGKTYYEDDADLQEASYRDSGYSNMLKASRKADRIADQDRKKREEQERKKPVEEEFRNWTFEMSPGDRTKVLHGDHKGKRGIVVTKHNGGESYTIRHADGSTIKHHVSTLSEPIKESATIQKPTADINTKFTHTVLHTDPEKIKKRLPRLQGATEVDEDVETVDYKNVKVVTASGKTIWRKQKTKREIIDSDDVHDGEPKGKH